MSKTELQDYCGNIASALQGLGGIRQLYLQLEVIKTPTKSTILENQKKGGETEVNKDSNESKADDANPLDEEDAEKDFREIIQNLDGWFKDGKHQHLSKALCREFDSILKGSRDLFAPLLK